MCLPARQERHSTHCVLEFCQKPASVLLPCSSCPSPLLPLLSPPSLCTSLLLIPVSLSLSTRCEFHFNKCHPCICLFSFEELRWYGVQMRAWLALVHISDEIKFNKVRLHKAAAKTKNVKVTSRGRKVSACISWEHADNTTVAINEGNTKNAAFVLNNFLSLCPKGVFESQSAV